MLKLTFYSWFFFKKTSNLFFKIGIDRIILIVYSEHEWCIMFHV